MRWDQLFDDLEGRFEHEADAEQSAQLAERVRADRARTSLTGRLQLHRGAVRLVLRHGRLVTGALVDAGADWVEVEGDPRGATIVPLGAIVEIDGLGWGSAPDTALGGRLRLGHPLRRLARDREVVEVLDLLGRELVGTIDAVGADAFDLALHPRELPRRRANLTGRPTIPFRAVVCVTAVGLADSDA